MELQQKKKKADGHSVTRSQRLTASAATLTFEGCSQRVLPWRPATRDVADAEADTWRPNCSRPSGSACVRPDEARPPQLRRTPGPSTSSWAEKKWDKRTSQRGALQIEEEVDAPRRGIRKLAEKKQARAAEAKARAVEKQPKIREPRLASKRSRSQRWPPTSCCASHSA